MKCLALLAIAVMALGCATTKPRPAPLAQADIISMVKAGMTDEEIMRRIDATGTVFRLNSDDVMFLRKEGLSDRLVNYMLDTYTRAAVEAQRRRDESNYRFSFGYYYGPYWHHRHPWYW
jgi:hypothetical protein